VINLFGKLLREYSDQPQDQVIVWSSTGEQTGAINGRIHPGQGIAEARREGPPWASLLRWLISCGSR